MQKKLIALAVAGLASSAAFAQSNVTIYGLLQPSYDMMDVKGGAAGNITGDVTNMAYNNSRIGFKGEEALGNGLKAIFQIESKVDLVDRGADAGGLGDRDSFVGLAGAFGSLTFGKHQTAYKKMADFADPFADSIGDYNNIMAVMPGTAGGRFGCTVNDVTNVCEDNRGGDEFNARRGNQFIADLMPKHPIYTALLSEAARQVMGQPHYSGRPAMRMLESEGFAFQNYIDIFDGGPTMTVETDRIRTIREAEHDRIAALSTDRDAEAAHIVATGRLDGFRACLGRVSAADGGVMLDARAAELLKVGVGDMVTFAPA